MAHKPRTFDEINLCIYCEEDQLPLTDEHIIPLSLGGELILPKATCHACAGITSRMTAMVARSMYGRLRVRLGAPTRRPKNRPKGFDLIVIDKNGESRAVRIPAKKWPRVYQVLDLPEAEILSGIKAQTFQLVTRGDEDEMNDLVRDGYVKPGEKIDFQSVMNAKIFVRQLAQVAHAFAAAIVGLDGYTPHLPPLILDETTDPTDSFRYIGCLKGGATPTEDLSLEIIERSGIAYLVCLFSMPKLGWQFPTYQIVCGTFLDEGSRQSVQSRIDAENRARQK